jgi:polar amino acid transport system permease protein
VTGRLLAQQSQGDWDWEFALEILPALLQGLKVTVQATIMGILVAMTLGLVLAMARRSPRKLISWPVGGLVEGVRSTPLLAQLFFLYFVLPEFGIVLSPLVIGVLGLGIHYACYTSESYRAGIESVPSGQWEAAVALNMSQATRWRYVVLPQAVPTVIPALGNYLVAMFKEAPLLSTVTVLELLAVARSIQSVTFRGLEPFTMAGLLFLAVSIPASILVRYLERRYGYVRA